MARIGIVVPYENLYDEVKEVASHFGDIDIRVGYLEGAVDMAKELIANGAEVLIARGGTYICFKEAFPYMPIVEIEVGSYDIARAVREAKRVDNNVAFIVFRNFLFENIELEPLFDCHIKTFYIDAPDNIEGITQDALDEGFKVLVGGKLTEQISNQLGVRNVMIKSGRDSIYRAMRQAHDMLQMKDDVAINLNLIKEVVENTMIGIVAVNEKGEVSIANKKALDLMKRNRRQVIGTRIDTLFPALSEREDGELAAELDGERLVLSVQSKQIKSMDISSVITIEKFSEISEKDRDLKSRYVNRGYKAHYTFGDIKGECAAIRETIEIARRFAEVDSTVLIQGETGTGKELFAQSIHNASMRRNQPFVAINCAALTESLLESELFGYAKGAFTGAASQGKVGLFEIADGGTIFLDEIGEIPKTIQAKLLRVIQEREVMRIGDDRIIPIDVRIIAATNQNLLKLIEDGCFRRDLYYRIGVLRVRIPSLSEREGDLKELFNELITFYSSRHARKKPIIDESCFKVLRSYTWPGNVRELRNLVERLVIVHEGKVILPSMLNQFLDVEIKTEIQDLGEEQVRALLERNGNNKSKTAKALGISRTTLWKMLKQWGIE